MTPWVSFRQLNKAILGWVITISWLTGFLLVVWKIVSSPSALGNVEGYIAILAVTGVFVKDIIKDIFQSTD